MGPLLPKLRGHLAEFLGHDSLEHLRILSSPTCVGLRYGLLYATRSRDFLAGMLTGAVQLSEDARYCQVSAEAYALQRAIPSARGRVTPRSHDLL